MTEKIIAQLFVQELVDCLGNSDLHSLQRDTPRAEACRIARRPLWNDCQSRTLSGIIYIIKVTERHALLYKHVKPYVAKESQIPDRGGYLYAWFEVMSTSSTPAFCLLVNDPISLGGHAVKWQAYECTCPPFGSDQQQDVRIYSWSSTAKRSKIVGTRHVDSRTLIHVKLIRPWSICCYW